MHVFFGLKHFILLLLFIVTSFIFAQSDFKPLILTIVSAPENKIGRWNDGFVAAMKILEDEYDITYLNLPTMKLFKQIPTTEFFHSGLNFNDFDMVLVKSNWGPPHEFAMKNISMNIPCALLISGVKIPTKKEMLFYDVLFYETEWYHPNIEEHSQTIHAFGINSDLMKPPIFPVIKKYDYISVGCFDSHKRYDLLLQRPGKRLAVGSNGPSNPIHQLLVEGGVEVVTTIPPEELVELYHQSECCYIPCLINGGGERTLLEARSCGIRVEIEPDNPKLKELCESPIYDHIYYAAQLKKGIEGMLKSKNDGGCSAIRSNSKTHEDLNFHESSLPSRFGEIE